MRHLFKRAEDRLGGWPDTALTVGLIAVAIIAVVIALFAPRLVKLGVLAWFALP